MLRIEPTDPREPAEGAKSFPMRAFWQAHP
jgi:hypothetical protein